METGDPLSSPVCVPCLCDGKGTAFMRASVCGHKKDAGTSLLVQRLRISASSEVGAGSILGQGAEILHAWWSKNQNINPKQYCNKFSKNFKSGPHQKK